MKKTLIVTGTFGEDNKISFLGHQIIEVFKKRFDVTALNGGSLSDLDSILQKINEFEIVFWLPNIDNSVDKYLPVIKEKNKTCILIQSKRNDADKYTTFEIIERMFKVHANLCLVINKTDKYNFKIIDPLGNLWYDGNDFTRTISILANRVEFISILTRIKSRQDDFLTTPIEIEPDFITIIQEYATTFTNLIQSAVNKERFLGNVSTRCMSGFPSIKCDDNIFVSKRNVDKSRISSKDFVAVKRYEDGVVYSGDNKPSVDTPIQIRLYNYYDKIKYIIHGHVYVAGAPSTHLSIPCGYVEEVEEVKKLFPWRSTSNFCVNLIGHGCLILAEDLSFLHRQVYARDFPERLYE
jgi:hypothetical protein